MRTEPRDYALDDDELEALDHKFYDYLDHKILKLSNEISILRRNVKTLSFTLIIIGLTMFFVNVF